MKLSENVSSTSKTETNSTGKEYLKEYYQNLFKRRRLSAEVSNQYIDCSFCVATTNTVERLFSACKHVLTDGRKRMSPIMFEALVFLKVNKKFWDLPMVAKAMKNKELRENERDVDLYYE